MKVFAQINDRIIFFGKKMSYELLKVEYVFLYSEKNI